MSAEAVAAVAVGPLVGSILSLAMLGGALWILGRLVLERERPAAARAEVVHVDSDLVNEHGEPASEDPLGAYAVRLALTFSSWVHRRVERFEFLDSETVRRHVSIDFTLPSDDGFAKGDVVAVPVMLLRKEVLRGLDVTRGDGRSLNVLESTEGRDRALGGLLVWLRRLAGPGFAAGARGTLETILQDAPEPAKEKVELALERGGEVRAALMTEDEEAAGAMEALIRELAEGFMLLVSLPYRPGRPTLVKVSYDARLEGPVREGTYGRRAALARSYLLFNRVFSSLGLMGRTEYFQRLPLRLGRSYHAEVLPAPGTYCGETALTIIPGDEQVVSWDGPSQEAVYQDAHPSRPHLWVGGGGHGTNRGERGRIKVVLHARRDGLVFPLFFSAAVIAGVLAFVVTQDGRLDGITLGALLLAPVALAAYYARSDENGYLTAAMRGVRGLATVSVVAGITVIALLGLGYIQPHGVDGQPPLASDSTALVITRWAGRAALLCADALGLAVIAPTVAAATRSLIGKGAEGGARATDTQLTVRDLALVAVPLLVLAGVGAALACAMLILLPW